MIWAREMPSHAYLPYIPSFRLTHSLTWSLPFFKAFSPKLGLTHRFVAKQTRFNPATDLIANSPEAYHLHWALMLASRCQCVRDSHFVWD